MRPLIHTFVRSFSRHLLSPSFNLLLLLCSHTRTMWLNRLKRNLSSCSLIQIYIPLLVAALSASSCCVIRARCCSLCSGDRGHGQTEEIMKEKPREEREETY